MIDCLLALSPLLCLLSPQYNNCVNVPAHVERSLLHHLAFSL
jgi:hypothetical protein